MNLAQAKQRIAELEKQLEKFQKPAETVLLTEENSVSDSRPYKDKGEGLRMTPPGPWEVKLIAITGTHKNGLPGMRRYDPNNPTTRGERETAARVKVLGNHQTPNASVQQTYVAKKKW